jgi:hypothetical protein
MMKSVTRREAIVAAAAGTTALAAAAAGAADTPPKKKKHNTEPPVPSKAKPESVGPRELFAVVDRDGTLRRGLHAVSSQALENGVYEVIFNRDVRRGVYLATLGGHGFEGMPLMGSIAVVGRATDPRGVLVFITDLSGDQIGSGFHLLVVCPEGYAQ